MTSTLIQLVSSASRASSAVMIASRAVSQPAVFGRNRRPCRIFTVSEPWPWSETRRIEAVAMSAPEAATASRMMICVGYPAVPMRRREVSVTPAITNGSSASE